MDEYKFNNPFPKRFTALLDGKISTPANKEATTHTKFAKEVLFRSRQSVGRYADGTTPPDILDLQRIAHHYQVSCDWLLGIDTCITKDIEEISSKYGLNQAVLLRLEKLAFNPFTKQGKYMEGSVPIIELINNLINDDTENGVLNAIIEYLYADTIYTIDEFDLQNVNDDDEAYKLKERIKEVDKTLLDTSLFFNLQVKLRQLKEKLNPITNYK